MNIYEELNKLGIKYKKHEHAPVFTVAEADAANKDIPGAHCKNLFLRNKKGDRHFLVILPAHKNFDIRSFGETVDEKHLSFASPERLKKYLGVIPGSVTPLALINDSGHAVRVLVDRELSKSEEINFHPNRNDATLTLSTRDFERFLEAQENPVKFIGL